MHILHIAPEPPGQEPLDWSGEFTEISDIEGVSVDSVGGPLATRRRITSSLRKEHDIVIWSGHGAPDRLYLSAGTPVDGPWLATYIKAGAPRIAIIAACMSDAPDDALDSIASAISRTGVTVVSMSCDVPDGAAKTYVVEFARAMAANADVGMAHNVAIHAMDMEIPGSGKIPRLVPGLTNGYRGIIDRPDRNDARLVAVEAQGRDMAGELSVVRAMVELVAKQMGVA